MPVSPLGLLTTRRSTLPPIRGREYHFGPSPRPRLPAENRDHRPAQPDAKALRTTMRIRNIAGALICSFLLFPQALAQPETITLAYSGGPGSVIDLAAQEFARRVEARTGGSVEMVLFGSGQLGSDLELLLKLRLGTVDLALPGTVMSSQVPLFGLFDLPYLIRDRAHMVQIRGTVIEPFLVPAASQQGYRILAVWENGFRHVTNNVRPIVSPEDLRGIRLRVPEGAWRLRMFEVLGASPTPMPFSELYLALQSGVIDGQENPLTQIHSARLYEVQTFLSLTGHVYSPVYLTAGARWSRLDPLLQELLSEIGRDVEQFSLETGANLEDDLLAKLTAAGMRVNKADRQAFRAASRAIYQIFSSEVPQGELLIQLATESEEGAPP
jgi:TRAP-type transport system periplasmic protein